MNTDNNENINNENLENDGAENSTNNKLGEHNETSNNDSITLTQEELSKRIQSAEDKLRTEYSKQIKSLKEEIKTLKPKEKTPEQIDFETRLAALEKRENEIKKNDLLASKNIDKSLAQFLKDDIDVDALSSALSSVYSAKLLDNSFVPTGHKAGQSLTKEDFKKMNMDEREKLFNENPELYKVLRK